MLKIIANLDSRCVDLYDMYIYYMYSCYMYILYCTHVFDLNKNSENPDYNCAKADKT